MTTSITRSDRAELVARAVELQPLLRERAGQMDAERHLADEVNAALVDAGMFRLLTPKRLGGYEADLRTTVEVVSTLGEADGSVAWLVGIGTGASWLLGMVSSDAWQDPKNWSTFLRESIISECVGKPTQLVAGRRVSVPRRVSMGRVVGPVIPSSGFQGAGRRGRGSYIRMRPAAICAFTLMFCATRCAHAG
jgi:hypothetical protein